MWIHVLMANAIAVNPKGINAVALPINVQGESVSAELTLHVPPPMWTLAAIMLKPEEHVPVEEEQPVVEQLTHVHQVRTSFKSYCKS